MPLSGADGELQAAKCQVIIASPSCTVFPIIFTIFFYQNKVLPMFERTRITNSTTESQYNTRFLCYTSLTCFKISLRKFRFLDIKLLSDWSLGSLFNFERWISCQGLLKYEIVCCNISFNNSEFVVDMK